MTTENFGEHFMLDGYLGDESLLNDKDVVLNCFKDLPTALGMHTLVDPVVVFAEGDDKKDPGGWSGFVIIMESHISVHTFPKRGFVSIDVYSCKNGMDTDKIQNYFKDIFKLKEVETNFVKRGTKYPTFNLY